MVLSTDAENHVVARQADFHHHMIAGHLFQQFMRVVFIHDVHAVPDALGFRFFNCKPDVAAKSFVSHEARRQLARVEGQMNF